MSYVLLRSSAFVRDAKRLLRKHPDLIPQMRTTLELLQTDPYTPSLKTHKLKGKPAILLESAGTHDEVY